jgi:hypothetical protein
MKLSDLFENLQPEPHPIFAWLEPSRGPEDILGVRLAYIEPSEWRYNKNIADATAAGDERWLKNVKRNPPPKSKVLHDAGSWMVGQY